MRQSIFRTTRNAAYTVSRMRTYVQTHTPPQTYYTDEGEPRHLLCIGDLNCNELRQLVLNAKKHKDAVKNGKGIDTKLRQKFLGKTVAMMFNKRSTRTRVSTESAVAMLGGHPMFLGKDDIQLGVNESLYDTSKIISSMTDCMVARVHSHEDICNLSLHSSVPVINALSDAFHPLQAIADSLTLMEHFGTEPGHFPKGHARIKVAWVGDANNVCFDLAMACIKLGINMTIATPRGYAVPEMHETFLRLHANAQINPGFVKLTHDIEDAVEDANVIVTDTWVSMGQEDEKERRMKAFEGWQVTEDMAEKYGADEDWKFMHCMPRHPEEVDDEVFYGHRSLVFQEGENRLWAALAVLEAFKVDEWNALTPEQRMAQTKWEREAAKEFTGGKSVDERYEEMINKWYPQRRKIPKEADTSSNPNRYAHFGRAKEEKKKDE
ncbi:putative ornithine carbamoyl transferase [Xylariaceae sp. FL0255]|nr:putative ornithine carbamoyl transferase [Xylariaceae sp. FL0255]